LDRAACVTRNAQWPRTIISRCSNRGQSRRFDDAPITSGLPLYTDVASIGRHVSEVPDSDITGIGKAVRSTTTGQPPSFGRRRGGFWMVCRELVFKLWHGLQFILGGVIHRMIGIPTFTGAGCGGCRGGRCGTRGGSRGAVWSGSSCRSIRRCGCC
jgi:hypothetical protein